MHTAIRETATARVGPPENCGRRVPGTELWWSCAHIPEPGERGILKGESEMYFAEHDSPC